MKLIHNIKTGVSALIGRVESKGDITFLKMRVAELSINI